MLVRLCLHTAVTQRLAQSGELAGCNVLQDILALVVERQIEPLVRVEKVFNLIVVRRRSCGGRIA